jgi:hypothetical protein
MIRSAAMDAGDLLKRLPRWSLVAAAVPLAAIAGYAIWLRQSPPIDAAPQSPGVNPSSSAAGANKVAPDHPWSATAPEASLRPGAFDSRTAFKLLTDAARTAGVKCNRPDARVRNGRVVVTFETSGRVSSAAIQGEAQGTPIGECVQKEFQGLTVPPFEGKPVNIGKAFFLATPRN